MTTIGIDNQLPAGIKMKKLRERLTNSMLPLLSVSVFCNAFSWFCLDTRCHPFLPYAFRSSVKLFQGKLYFGSLSCWDLVLLMPILASMQLKRKSWSLLGTVIIFLILLHFSSLDVSSRSYRNDFVFYGVSVEKTGCFRAKKNRSDFMGY